MRSAPPPRPWRSPGAHPPEPTCESRHAIPHESLTCSHDTSARFLICHFSLCFLFVVPPPRPSSEPARRLQVSPLPPPTVRQAGSPGPGAFFVLPQRVGGQGWALGVGVERDHHPSAWFEDGPANSKAIPVRSSLCFICCGRDGRGRRAVRAGSAGVRGRELLVCFPVDRSHPRFMRAARRLGSWGDVGDSYLGG